MSILTDCLRIASAFPCDPRMRQMLEQAADKIDELQQDVERLQGEKAKMIEAAESYDDWTYWGQDNNASAASAATAEIAEAVRLGRPLTPDEIRAVDAKRKRK